MKVDFTSAPHVILLYTFRALFDVPSVITLGDLTLLTKTHKLNNRDTLTEGNFPTNGHEGMFTNKPHNEALAVSDVVLTTFGLYRCS